MTNLERDPLEQLLDEQSDSEFGLPEFKEQKQVLANWSAQDFSDIYVRFYPHLLRHAKRYLTNHSQAEEVVQDAFLYLMTSLPEIDSELGVLKLLKWKVRNLAFDVISANGKASFAPVDDVDLPVEHELSENLIRADEASIVSLALAKLNPRHREALIASLYEEKETAKIANQMGLSENATRQLLFRAKSAFKKALVGEAETAGMSVSQILSIAARKAAQDSGKYISAASAFLLLLAFSFGVLPNLPRQAEIQVSAPFAEVERPTPLETESAEENVPAPEPETNTQTVAAFAETDSAKTSDFADSPTLSISTASLSPYLNLEVQQAEVVKEGTSFFPNSVSVIKIHSGIGLWAYVDYDPVSMSINAVAFEVMIDGDKYYASPRSYGSAMSQSDSGYTLTYSATEIYLVDPRKNVISDQALANAFVTISMYLDLNSEVTGANLFIKP